MSEPRTPSERAASARQWLLLIHQVPAKPDYLRVKVGRRLQRVGAVPVKPGVYALPAGEEAREDLGWIVREVVDGGGEAQVVEARLVDGLDDDALVARFNAARDEEAAPLVEALRAMSEGHDPELKRLRKRLDDLCAIDFFGSTKVMEARRWLCRLDEARSPAAPQTERTELTGKVWVTRAGIKVDRMASAWLVRRFVDPDAAFRFVPGRSHRPEPGEVRFDMVEAEFGHEGDACTFEVLARRLGLVDAGLRPIAELVHDVDCKDGKFARPETEGFAMTVEAIAAAHPTDEARLERASAWLDDLHRWFGGGR
jgi:hypothetical protein